MFKKKIAASRHSKKNSKTASRFSCSKKNCPCSKNNSDFHRKYPKSMFSGAVRRPGEKIDSLFAFSRSFPLFFSLRTSKNKLLNTIFKKIFRLFRRHSKKNSKKTRKPLRGFRVQKIIANVQKK